MHVVQWCRGVPGCAFLTQCGPPSPRLRSLNPGPVTLESVAGYLNLGTTLRHRSASTWMPLPVRYLDYRLRTSRTGASAPDRASSLHSASLLSLGANSPTHPSQDASRHFNGVIRPQFAILQKCQPYLFLHRGIILSSTPDPGLSLPSNPSYSKLSQGA